MTSHEPLGRAELQQRAVRGALWTGIHTFVSLPLAFAVNILVARVLGVADYGRLAYLMTVIGIASVIAGMGVTTALVQFGSKAHAVGDRAEVRRLLSGAQGFRIMVVGPVVALVVLSLVRVDWWLLGLALVFGVGLPALLSNAHPALTIENRTDRSAQLTMVGNLVVQFAVVVAVMATASPDAVWSARVMASGLLLALPLLTISAPYRRAVLRPSWPWRLPRRFWVFALPTGAAGIIGALVSDRTELILLDWFADERAMGLYGLAFGLAGHVYAPAQAFIGPLVPAVSGLSAVDQASLRRAFLRTTRAGAVVGGLLVAAGLPALASLVPLIYGRDFAPASDLLIIVGIGSAVALIGAPHQAFLMARLGGGRLLWINLVSLVINLALALVLIPLVGAVGAAVACAGALMGRAIQLTVGEARALGLGFGDLMSSAGALVLAVGLAAGPWLFVRQLEVAEIPLALTQGLVGLACYLVGLKILRTGLTPGDVHAIGSALPSGVASVGRPLLALLTGSRAKW